MALFDGLGTTTALSGKTSGAGGTRFSNSNSSYNTDYLNMLSSITDRNNAISLQNAREQMGFQASQALQAQKFNQQEAEKTRKWQEMMSNTSHQREVKDLIKAGLNPVLSANLNGASSPAGSTASASGIPNGAMAQVDTSLASALVNLMSATINSTTAISTNRYSSNTSYKSSKYKADTDLTGTIIKSLLGIIDFF